MKRQIGRLASAGAVMLLATAGAAFADGVTAVTVTPNSGKADTPFTVHVAGTGQCIVQLALRREDPDGFPWSGISNLNVPFPIAAPLQSPWPLKPGKYHIKAKTLAAQHPGCVLGQESATSFTVVATVPSGVMQGAPLVVTPVIPAGGGKPPSAPGQPGANKPPCKQLGKPGVGKDCAD